MLGTAAIGKLGLDLVVAARVLGVVSGAATIAAIGRFSRGAAILAAASAPLAIWMVGGLEGALVCALVAGALVSLADEEKSLHVGGLLLGLLCLTRPDGFVLGGAIAVGVALARRDVRAGAILVGWTMALSLGQTAFRASYHGDWVPSTVRAKATLASARVVPGLLYVTGALGSSWALLLAGGLGLRSFREDRRAVLFGVPLVLWCAYLVTVGDDAFPGWRLFLPALVCLALLAGVALERLPASRARQAPVGVAILATASLLTSLVDPRCRWAKTDHVAKDGLATGAALARAFGKERPLVAVDAAGGIPYASGLPSLDMLGLVDQHIARTRAADFGAGLVGHELGDGAYVLAREPDLVLFCGGAGGQKPCYRSGHEMAKLPAWKEGYELVALLAADDVPPALVFVRRDSPRVGIVREADRVRVPGHLFATTMGSRARQLPDGRFAATTTRGTPSRLRRVRLPKGKWTPRIESLGDRPVLEIKKDDGAVVLAGDDGIPFALEADANLSVVAGSLAGPSAIVSLTFERVAE